MSNYPSKATVERLYYRQDDKPSYYIHRIKRWEDAVNNLKNGQYIHINDSIQIPSDSSDSLYVLPIDCKVDNMKDLKKLEYHILDQI